MTDTPSTRDILDFWFLPLGHPDHGKPREEWWTAPPAFDAEIGARFGTAFDRAVTGAFDHWRHSPDGALALILLCDQFPRNMYRRTAKAYAGDAKGLETARIALARHHPPAFNLTMRLFFFLPFQHSEDVADQDLGCALFAAFDDEETMQHATEHRDIIVLSAVSAPQRRARRTCTDDELNN